MYSLTGSCPLLSVIYNLAAKVNLIFLDALIVTMARLAHQPAAVGFFLVFLPTTSDKYTLVLCAVDFRFPSVISFCRYTAWFE